MKGPARRACKIDFVVESELWEEAGNLKPLLRSAVAEAAQVLSTGGAELAIVLTDDSTIRLLNRDWRGVDKATNVLSFPTETFGGKPRLLGDIVLAYETVAREAHTEGKPFAHHLAHLTVHGFLHLNGYDHERKREAEKMEELERQILRRLAIPDPYAPVARSRARRHALPRRAEPGETR